MEPDLSPFCASYTKAVEIIGRKWTGSILRAMLAGQARFTDIAATVPGLSDRLLSQRLKELETEGIVLRTVTASTPVCITYTLTDKGQALTPVIESVEAWSADWVDTPAS